MDGHNREENSFLPRTHWVFCPSDQTEEENSSDHHYVSVPKMEGGTWKGKMDHIKPALIFGCYIVGRWEREKSGRQRALILVLPKIGKL